MKLPLNFAARTKLEEQIREFLDSYQTSLEAGMPDQERWIKLLIVDHLRSVGKKMATAGFEADMSDDDVTISLQPAEEASLRLMLSYLPTEAAYMVSMALKVEAPRHKSLKA